jgi:hypothetical protein
MAKEMLSPEKPRKAMEQHRSAMLRGGMATHRIDRKRKCFAQNSMAAEMQGRAWDRSGNALDSHGRALACAATEMK